MASLLLVALCSPLALAGGSGGGGSSSPALTPNPRAASLLGGVGTTTIAGTDTYSGLTFNSGTTIAGPFEAGFDSQIDTLLGWLGCSPSSSGYLAGGTDTQTALEQVNRQCSASLPTVSGGVFKSLMYACGVHSPPSNGCTSPPGGGVSGYAACTSPSYHFVRGNTHAASHTLSVSLPLFLFRSL